MPATGENASGRYDWRGTLALGTAAIGLLVALTLVVPLGWASPVTAGLLGLAVVATVTWGYLESRVRDPLIDVHALLAVPVLRANLASMGMGWALFGTYLLVPVFAMAHPASSHYGLAASTAAVGLIMLPLAVGQTVAGPLAGLVSRHLSPQAVFAGGLVLLAAGLGWLSAIRGGLPQVAAALLLLGVGAGAALQSASDVVTQGVSADVAAASSSLNSTVRRFAGGIGGQFATILLVSYPVITAGAPHFAAFTVAYLAAAGLCLVGAVTVTWGALTAVVGRADLPACGSGRVRERHGVGSAAQSEPSGATRPWACSCCSRR